MQANYFLIGQMAQTYPYLVRRIYNEGHTVGTHTLDHPLLLKRLPLSQVAHEVDGGIAAVQAAIGDPKAVAPFFRIPGLSRSDAIDSFLASKSLVTWSADVVADDWFRRITPQQIVQRAIQRLDAKGRGILLLHDIHPATALALPSLLKELKEQGYQVVHVVPAGDMPKSVPELPAPAAIANGAWPRVLHTNPTSGATDGYFSSSSQKTRHQQDPLGMIDFRFAPKADMCSALGDVRFVPIADMTLVD